MISKERENKVKSLRIFQIDRLIRDNTYPNVLQMMKLFEVSRSTIMRDLEFLHNRYEAPLEYDKSKKGYYYTDPTFFIKSMMLTEGELFTITAIIPLLEQYKNTPLESSFRNILNKIMELLPDQVQVDSLLNIREFTFIKDPLPTINEKTFNLVFDSVRQKKTLEFGYRSISKKEYTTRLFDPYNVLCQNGNWYVIGYCHKHRRINIYAFSRMIDAAITEKSFSVMKDFDVKNHIDPELGIWNSQGAEKVKVELLFSSAISTYILERTWHADQECCQNDDGSVYLSFWSNQIKEILFWVLHFGSAVKVLNPPELRDLAAKEVKLMSEIYADSD